MPLLKPSFGSRMSSSRSIYNLSKSAESKVFLVKEDKVSDSVFFKLNKRGEISATTPIERKDYFLKVRNFPIHYIDEEQFVSLYREWFREATVRKIVAEFTGETADNFFVGIPNVLDIEGADARHGRLQAEYDLNPLGIGGMFRRFHSAALLTNQVILNLDLCCLKLKDLQ